MSERPMFPIPVSVAREVADRYGYDQVVIIARRVGEPPDPCGEHVTTDGVDERHALAAARAGVALKRFMGWPDDVIREAHRPAHFKPDMSAERLAAALRPFAAMSRNIAEQFDDGETRVPVDFVQKWGTAADSIAVSAFREAVAALKAWEAGE